MIAFHSHAFLHVLASVAAATLLGSSVAAAQVQPGDLVTRANPNGNTVAIHRQDGTLIARGDGPDTDWRIGVAMTPDFGWVTFRLDINVQPAGWRMMRFDSNGSLVAEVLAPQIAEIPQFGVDRTSDGIVLVSDVFRSRVHRYAPDGTFIDFIDLVPVGMVGHKIEATDDGGFWLFGGQFGTVGRGVRFDRSGQVTGNVTFGDAIQDVELLPDGSFWTSRLNWPIVTHWDSSGAFIESFSFDLGTTPAGQPRTPSGLAARPDGTLWVSVQLSERITRLNPSGQVLEFFDSAADYAATEIRLVRPLQSLGDAYCAVAPNQSGGPGTLRAFGTVATSENAFALEASAIPNFTFGYFLASRQSGFVAQPAGSAGNLCLGGAIGRFVGAGQVQNSGADGTFTIPVDLTAIPTPGGLTGVNPGDTWYFQAWFRDAAQGAPTSNFTQGLQVTFL